MSDENGTQTIRFKVTKADVEGLTWAEIERLELVMAGNANAMTTRLIMMKFMVDKAGKPLSEADARQAIRSLTGYLETKDELVRQFREAFDEALVPKANGTS